MRALNTLGPATEAAILFAVADAPHPKIALPTIAHHHQILLTDLQTLINRNGYPAAQAMRQAAQRLQHAATTEDTPTPDPAPDGRERLVYVALSDLHPDPDNVRDRADDDITGLAKTIADIGLMQPIVARRDGTRLVIVAGHRRYAAVRKLGWVEVACVIRNAMRPADVLAAMIIENSQRKDLDPIEEARGLQRIKVEHGFNDSALATKVGRTQVHVSGRLALLSLSPEEQAEVRAGAMSLTEAQHKGRMNSGRVGKTGVDRNWHLGPQHDLADLAKNRCTRAKHGRGRTVGGMACGACWESVIRADEKKHLQEYSIRTGTCTTCGSTHERTDT